MLKIIANKKGVAVYLVMSMIIAVVIIAGAVMNIMLNQSRRTQHSVGRIQAYYASQAGLFYAMEKMRQGSWVAGSDCLPTSVPLCSYTFAADDFYPPSIDGNQVFIIIRKNGTSGCNSSSVPPPPNGSNCISVKTTYTSS